MAEPLKNMFGPEMVHRTARSIDRVYPDFDVAGFTHQALVDFDALELTERCRQIGDALASWLPTDRRRAIDILIDSLGPELENCDPTDASPLGDPTIDDNPMSGFFYMSHGYFLAEHCDDNFDAVIRANYELTKRATSEFSIRAPLRDHTMATLRELEMWTTDPNVHVRRCVSEGTRPRLPWSFRLKVFQDDPTPVLRLLEMLRDDPVEYVRRSVANNLNDIAKDHPDLVVATTKRWWSDADENRRRLIKHSLRTLIKAGHPDALDVLGYGPSSPAVIGAVSIEPRKPRIGEKVSVEIRVDNPSTAPCRALVDLRVHFVKANGSTSPKVFKGAELSLQAGESAGVRKTISVAQQTTRTHHPGEHFVEIMVNGVVCPAGSFSLHG